MNKKTLIKKSTLLLKEYQDLMIYGLGRMNGWACFQDNYNEDIEEILESIIEWNIEKMYYNTDELFDDIMIKLNNIEAMIKEIKYIKNYIYNFNKNLDFSEKVKYRIEEKIDEIDEVDKELAEDKKTLIDDIKDYTVKIQDRLDIHKKNKELIKKIQRHLTGIVKILED